MLFDISRQLISALDSQLVDALLKAYNELKNHYYLGKHKPSELEGGHFAEVVIRILEYVTTKSYTPLGNPLPRFDVKEVERYAQLPNADFPDSIRIHIPRAVLTIYGIRNRRGVGHVAGDINPNLSDSTFIVATCDWIMTELISLYYTSSVEEAQKLVDTIVARKVPLVQDFGGFQKILDPGLTISAKTLVLLYQRGADGASSEELWTWIKTRPSYLHKVLQKLDDEAYIHYSAGWCWITRAGEAYVEANVPLHIASASLS